MLLFFWFNCNHGLRRPEIKKDVVIDILHFLWFW